MPTGVAHTVIKQLGNAVRICTSAASHFDWTIVLNVVCMLQHDHSLVSVFMW